MINMTMVNVVSKQVQGELVKQGSAWYVKRKGTMKRVPCAITEQQAIRQCSQYWGLVPIEQ